MMSKAEFLNQSERFTKWCQHALKFWASAAADPRGGYAEDLNMDGSANFETIRRVRVQSRQAYVYAHAGYLNWFEGAKPASDQASGAWRYRAFQDQTSLDTAKQTLKFLQDNLASSAGGWFESLPLPSDPQRRQNPHMHLFEAFIALYNATKSDEFLKLADRVFELFEAHFYDKKTGVLLEFFNPDWSPYGDGGPIEPGHMMEWAWLLACYSEISGRDTRCS